MKSLSGPGPRGGPDIDFGALVISLDFELLWGLRDLFPPDGGCYRRNLLGVREAIPRLLDLFAEFEIAATWATVGFLFAASRRELESYRPAVLPDYTDSGLSPYVQPIGDGEQDDPLHFAPSLIEAIRQRPRQEIGTHTYSHYYCLEPGQTRDAFAADLASALAIAADRGVRLRSIVFPRNQDNPEYFDLLREVNITSYRSGEASWMYCVHNASHGSRGIQRGGRMLDAYVNLSEMNVTPWGLVRQADGLCRIPSSRFLRPYSPRLRQFEPLRLRRIARGLRAAASTQGLFHLWWHPHNFGDHLDENLAFLRKVLEIFAECREHRGMRSLNMGDVTDVVDCG
jgi:peptidoglycan/xylan/chitin deacetylase (PgdA/CDA1 family)